MSRDDRFKANVAWHQLHQQCQLSLLVTVDQVRGTSATLYETRFVPPYRSEAVKLASYESDSKDNSTETMWNVHQIVMASYVNRLARAAELEIEPY